MTCLDLSHAEKKKISNISSQTDFLFRSLHHCPCGNAPDRVSGWATSADCKHGWSDVCDCLYQGTNLPEVLYENLMENLSSIALYGTSCAAWDHIPGTPLAHHCLPGSDWSGDKNWCQIPWCYWPAFKIVIFFCVCVWFSPSFIGDSTLDQLG